MVPATLGRPAGVATQIERGGMVVRNGQRTFYLTISALALLALVTAAPADAANGSVVHTYDALGRVLTASYDTGVIVIYSYDANGNRTQQVINVNTSTGLWGSQPGDPQGFNWDAALWD
jgi:YD repeat-containing protein